MSWLDKMLGRKTGEPGSPAKREEGGSVEPADRAEKRIERERQATDERPAGEHPAGERRAGPPDPW